jgi:NAD(P)-dependent dehydrogenase (short-subunit alcohol dehydrogenase family)
MQSLFDLSGRVALVTGSHRGIGFAMAQQLGRAGARVIVSSNEEAGLTQAVATLREEGIDTLGIPCDVLDDEGLANLVQRAESELGPLDILMANAGIGSRLGSMIDMTEEEYQTLMNVNLRSVIQLCKLVAPGMAERGRGSIVVTSSIAGLRGYSRAGLYAISKAAVAQLARNMAAEYGPSNVRVNAISPGLVDTQLAAAVVKDPVAGEQRKNLTPLRRFGQPQDIAGAALFLASDAAAYVTGHNLVVDGGYTIRE